MSRDDTLDPELARRFAWRTSLDGVGDAGSEPAPAAADGEDEDENEEERDPEAERLRWAQARRGAVELSEDIRRALAIKGKAAQAAATAALLLRVKRSMDVAICLRDHHPAELLPLWQLTVKHFRRLPARTQDDHVFGLVAATPPLDDPRTADLVEGVANLKDTTLLTVLETALEDKDPPRPRHQDVDARLAELVGTARRWSVRERAARYISDARVSEHAVALRRALRQPRLSLRATALARLHQASALGEDDVLWLLRDAEAHPLLGDAFEDHESGRAYAESLLEAAARVRPEGGFEPLEKITHWTHARRMSGPHCWDAKWALRALGAAYPEPGRAPLERELIRSFCRREEAALEGIARLPEAHARPLLREAAARANHRLADRARAIWSQRFGEELVVGELDGVPLSLLGGPPSDRLLGCLAVLRGPSDEARVKLLGALLDEGPGPGAGQLDDLSPSQREALALWIFAARDVPYDKRVPGSTYQIPKALVHRFGAAAFAGLALLAERDARAGLEYEWTSGLLRLFDAPPPVPPPRILDDPWSELDARLALGAPERARLREIARAGFASPSPQAGLSPLFRAGIRAEDTGMLLGLIMEAGSDERGDGARTAFVVQQMLARAGAIDGLDEQLEAAGREAWEARAWTAFARLASAGCDRRVPGVIRRVLELVDAPDLPPESHRAVLDAASSLPPDATDEGWIVARLRRPESLAFLVADRRSGATPTLAVLDALRDALGSSARDGGSAAEAAATLLHQGAIGPEDARLDLILERAPLRERARLAYQILAKHGPIELFRRHLLSVLTTGDIVDADAVLDEIEQHEPKGWKDLYEDALPFVTSAKVRAAIEHALGEPHEQLLYWQDTGDHIEDDEDDDPEDDVA